MKAPETLNQAGYWLARHPTVDELHHSPVFWSFVILLGALLVLYGMYIFKRGNKK